MISRDYKGETTVVSNVCFSLTNAAEIVEV